MDCCRYNWQQDFFVGKSRKTLSKQSLLRDSSRSTGASDDETGWGVLEIAKCYLDTEKIDIFLRQFFEKNQLLNHFFAKRRTPAWGAYRRGPKPLMILRSDRISLVKKTGNKIGNLTFHKLATRLRIILTAQFVENDSPRVRNAQLVKVTHFPQQYV